MTDPLFMISCIFSLFTQYVQKASIPGSLPCYQMAEPHTSVGSVVDLRTGGRWFDPQLSKYSFRGLTLVIATGFIPLSPLSVVLTMLCGKAARGLERILCKELVKRTPGKQG